MTALLELGYSSPEVCRLANVTYRQLDYWCRTGFIRDNAYGSGTARRFDDTDVRVATVLGCMTRVGFGRGGFGAVSDFGRRVVAHVREHGLDGQVVSEGGIVTVDLTAIEDPT